VICQKAIQTPYTCTGSTFEEWRGFSNGTPFFAQKFKKYGENNNIVPSL